MRTEQRVGGAAEKMEAVGGGRFNQEITPRRQCFVSRGERLLSTAILTTHVAPKLQ